MRSSSPSGPWVVVPAPNPSARLRLFCFPYAGGGASVFRGWPRALPAGVEVCAVQPPGREGRLAEPPFTRMAALVEAMEGALLPWMDRPFAFFGHSNGAVMAFELARRLRAAGRRGPLHLFASGRPAPQVELTDPPVHALPDAEFVAELRRLEGTPEEVLESPEMMELLLPLLRADFALSETYEYRGEPPLAVPLSAYGGRTDGEVPEWQVAAWEAQTTRAFRLRMFPGGHFFLAEDRDPVLAELSAELRALLAAPALAR